MLNLVKFNARANYPKEHDNAEKGLTGLQAYAEYGQYSGPIFERVGGTIKWRGDMQAMVIGPSGERWDTCFIAAYPNGGAFLEMVTDPQYRLAVVHRQSAVETSRLIRMKPLEVINSQFA